MSKLSDAQVKVLKSVHTTGELPKGTRQATITKLREELGFLLVTKIGEETNYTLTTDGREAIGADGDFTPDNIARAISEINAELDTNPWDETAPESDDDAVWFTVPNRKDRRDVHRAMARLNRKRMRDQGKRRKAYGADDSQYFRRKYVRMVAETSDTAYNAA